MNREGALGCVGEAAPGSSAGDSVYFCPACSSIFSITIAVEPPR